MKDVRSLQDKAHSKVKKVMNETRVPAKKAGVNGEVLKGPFASSRKHLKLASGWQNEFAVMQSRANNVIYRDKREFFDKPLHYQTGMNTSRAKKLKPMEVYHGLTPVRSV